MYSINQSARLIATFKTEHASTSTTNSSANYYDYSLLRYPEFYEILKTACRDGNINACIQEFSEGLRNELISYNLIVSDTHGNLIQNSQAKIYLSAFLRFIDAPTQREMLPLTELSSACLWVLESLDKNALAPTLQTLSTDDLNTLTNKGFLVSSQPTQKASYPSNKAEDAESLLKYATNLVLQRSGEPIPAKVLAMIGRQAPEISEAPIIWGIDAGTKLPIAAIASDQITDSDAIKKLNLNNGSSIKQRQDEWKTKLAKAKVEYKRDAFTEITHILPTANLTMIRSHIREMDTKNYFNAMGGDGHVARRKSIHNEPVAASLHYRLTKLVSAIVREKLKPSYAYLGRYYGGAVLERHIDRPQCQFNMSVVLDMCDEQGNDIPAWPIYLEANNKTHAVAMEVGSGLLYRGTDLEHWREALPEGRIVTACFYHFVSEDFTGSMI